MAAPGVGVGDIINACNYIYTLCIKYRDAVDEFNEIADKSRATVVVLQRIDRESKIKGNLVERAGPEAYSQLQDNLKSLRKDSEKLQALVKKYDKIHSEGPGRRLLFALKESSGLNDLRRRIGYHEQMLQIWYMTLVYGSLRRLEGGQEDMLKKLEDLNVAFREIQSWSPRKTEAVRESLRRGDTKPLEKELEKSGLDPETVQATLDDTALFVQVPPEEQVSMENTVQRTLSSIYSQPNEDEGYQNMPYSRSSRFSPFFTLPSKDYEWRPSPPYAGHGSYSDERLGKSDRRTSKGHAVEDAEEIEYRRRKKMEMAAAEAEGSERERRRKYVYFESAAYDDNDDNDDHYGNGPHITRTHPKGILKRSRSTSSRPAFPTVVPEASSSRDSGMPVPRTYDQSPRRGQKLPIRSGYPSVHQTGPRVREEVVIVPHDSTRDRERIRSRHNSEVPAYRPHVTTPRSPRSGALLKVPDRGLEYRSRSAEGWGENSGEARLERTERIERVEQRPSMERHPNTDRRPSAERGKGKAKATEEEVVIVRRASHGGYDERRPSVGQRASAEWRTSEVNGAAKGKGKGKATEEEVVVERRASRSNADRQPRVEDAVDESEVVIQVTEGRRRGESQEGEERRRPASHERDGREERRRPESRDREYTVRSSSTGSYTRTRRTSSVGSTEGTEGGRRIKMVDRMDRIDSMGT